jgi:GT2 family glycosyltransferase
MLRVKYVHVAEVSMVQAMSSTGETTHPKVGIVILNFNSPEDSERCLSSLAKLGYGPLETICVDNGSTDGSAEAIEKAFPKVRMVRTGRNAGFGAGMNAGFVQALHDGCDFVFCFNSDTLVDDPELIDKLVAPFRTDPKLGVTGPEEMDMSGTELLYSGPRGRHRYELKVSGAAYMMSREVLEKVGLLDDRFFLGYEDLDLFVRIERKGYGIRIVPGARFRHTRSAIIGRHAPMMTYLEARNEIVYFARHWGLSGFLERAVKQNLKRLPRYALIFAEQGRPDLFAAHVKGLKDGICLLPLAKTPDRIPPFDPAPWIAKSR